jgi:uncharacterized lipoprotein YddW (UPF0748 family)
MARIALCLALTLTALPAANADPLPREFRGVWVATVANIDWPSKPGLTIEEQKKELVTIFDRQKAIHMNAIVFQVRPMCDALYESKLEPWSSFLTGTSGKSPGYDPLAFAIQLAHERGMELHAWLNPYRAKSPAARGEMATNHLIRARPDIAKKYSKHYWLNPTHPDTAKHSLDVVKDIVTRYDIDGIHMDDYFYPYPELDEAKKEIPFPDDDTWAAYTQAGGKLSREDWRRDAVNRFVKDMNTEVHKIKPWVKVGLSPFGIWRPGHPAGIQGFDQYAKLYADAKLWWNEGWVDYFTPQLYWPIEPEKQSYPKLLDWWAKENTKHRHLWVGNSAGRHSPDEIRGQVALTRTAKAGGNIWFSERAIRGDKLEMLKTLYSKPALTPESPWLKDLAPAQPDLIMGNDGVILISGAGEGVRFVVVEDHTEKDTFYRITAPGEKGVVKHTPAKGTTETKAWFVNRAGSVSVHGSLK